MWGMAVPIEWSVMWAALPWPTVGVTLWPTSTILLDPACPPAMQRSTLAHELVHVERGPVVGWLAAREELIVEAEAARRLIALGDLGEALAESDHLCHIAEQLHVDPDTVTARLQSLTEAERTYLRHRLGRIHPTA